MAGGVRVRVRVTPRARAGGIDGTVRDARGTARLKVRVTAAPEDGRANAALVALLAKAWRLPKSDFVVAAGARDRNKTVEVAGDAAALLRSLEDWARTAPP
jgi:uncharacterized protein YggU (UPF0235/DUF167 family)